MYYCFNDVAEYLMQTHEQTYIVKIIKDKVNLITFGIAGNKRYNKTAICDLNELQQDSQKQKFISQTHWLNY